MLQYEWYAFVDALLTDDRNLYITKDLSTYILVYLNTQLHCKNQKYVPDIKPIVRRKFEKHNISTNNMAFAWINHPSPAE